jgi:hypothetical protein
MSQHTIPVVICSIVLHAFYRVLALLLTSLLHGNWLRKVSHSASTACSKN